MKFLRLSTISILLVFLLALVQSEASSSGASLSNSASADTTFMLSGTTFKLSKRRHHVRRRLQDTDTGTEQQQAGPGLFSIMVQWVGGAYQFSEAGLSGVARLTSILSSIVNSFVSISDALTGGGE